MTSAFCCFGHARPTRPATEPALPLRFRRGFEYLSSLGLPNAMCILETATIPKRYAPVMWPGELGEIRNCRTMPLWEVQLHGPMIELAPAPRVRAARRGRSSSAARTRRSWRWRGTAWRGGSTRCPGKRGRGWIFHQKGGVILHGAVLSTIETAPFGAMPAEKTGYGSSQRPFRHRRPPGSATHATNQSRAPSQSRMDVRTLSRTFGIPYAKSRTTAPSRSHLPFHCGGIGAPGFQSIPRTLTVPQHVFLPASQTSVTQFSRVSPLDQI